MTTSLYWSLGAVDAVEGACVLCGCHIQNDWMSRAMNLHHYLCWSWTFLCGYDWDDSGGHSNEQLLIGNFDMTTRLLLHLGSGRVFFIYTRFYLLFFYILFYFFIVVHVQRFLVRHQIMQVTQPLYSADLVHCDFWVFPKLKSPLKGKRFQTQAIDETQENMTGQLMVTERTVWGPKFPTLKGTEASLCCV